MMICVYAPKLYKYIQIKNLKLIKLHNNNMNILFVLLN